MPHYHTCTTVSLLRRPIANGRLSLYLDFYPAIRNPENDEDDTQGVFGYIHLCQAKE